MKKITVAICLDDNGGMMFNSRRQSRDRVLIGELCESVKGKIYIHDYSRLLFDAYSEKVIISDNPLSECSDGDVCFIENLRLAPYAEEIDEIILYKWNRLYPSDMKFDLSFNDYRVIQKKEFVGSSHDKITKLTLRKK